MHLDTLAATTRDVPDPGLEQLAAGRQRLDEAVRAADLRVAATHRRRSPRRWTITALAGAAAAAAVVLVVPLVAAPAASAEAVLLAAADAAGQQEDVAAGAAYWHVTSEIEYPGAPAHRRDVWQGRTGESVLRDESLAAEAAEGGALDPALVRTEDLGGPATFVVGGHTLSWADLEELPTDPDELESLLAEKVRDHPAGEDDQMWEGVTGLLRESPASPALRRALWQVLAGVPGVELVGATTDALGRPGTAIERDATADGWYRTVYVLDPTDGTLLESRDLDADGRLVLRSTEVSREPVAAAPAPQPPLCGPGSVPERSC